MEYRDNNIEFSEEDLMNVQGGFAQMSENAHPFEDTQIYGETQKEKLQELKKQLEEHENSPLRRSGR